MASPDTARQLPTDGPNAGGDEFDDILDYDIGGVNDILSENYRAPGVKEKPADSASKSKGGANLGIDEEVEVSRKPRAPRVKLDEHRLLSAAGIPKLRKKAKNHLKFKGRGHEYSDASNLLSFYQLWLDDLFPKARFLDALAMVEKTGHKRMMQVARMEWINEGKPRSSVHEDSIFDDPTLQLRVIDQREKTPSTVAPIFEKSANKLNPPASVENMELDDDDLYDATPPPRQPVSGDISQNSEAFGTASIFGNAKSSAVGDDVPEDDLDALLAEEEALQASSGNLQPVISAPKANSAEEIFEDDMEAMAEMEGMW